MAKIHPFQEFFLFYREQYNVLLHAKKSHRENENVFWCLLSRVQPPICKMKLPPCQRSHEPIARQMLAASFERAFKAFPGNKRSRRDLFAQAGKPPLSKNHGETFLNCWGCRGGGEKRVCFNIAKCRSEKASARQRGFSAFKRNATAACARNAEENGGKLEMLAWRTVKRN